MTSIMAAEIQWRRFRADLAAMLPTAAFGTFELRRKACKRLEKCRSVPSYFRLARKRRPDPWSEGGIP